MGDRFVPLSEYVLQPPEPVPEVLDPVPTVPVEEEQSRPLAHEAFGQVRRFRAAVFDAVDIAVRDVLCDVAAEVLARELELAPANVEAIVARACARIGDEDLVAVRIHPDEAGQLSLAGVNLIADSRLRRGDVLLQVRSGTIDLTLGARLAAVLDRIDL